MQRVNFNFNRELKSLFAKVIGGNQVQSNEEEKKEARPQNNYDGYSKKQRRILIMQDKLAQRQQKNVVAISKRQNLCNPDSRWPRIDPKMLTMKQVSIDKETGDKIFSFVKSKEYHSLQKEFSMVQGTMDIQQLANFLGRNFYHHESLIFIADYLRLQGKFTEAQGFLERCLFAYETAFCYEFQFVPPVDSTSNRNALESFQL